MAALAAIAPRLAVADAADGGFCPANLEQSDPCGADGGDVDSGSSRPPPLPGVTLGNPLSLVTGAKRQRETDFALEGGALAFRRHYDSANLDVDVGLGPGWRHSHAVSLYTRADGGREIVESSGRRILFRPESIDVNAIDAETGSGGIAGTGNAASPETEADTSAESNASGGTRYRPHFASDGVLVETADGHRWQLPDGRTLRFRGSWLVRVDWHAASGEPRSLSLRYRQRRLERITDERGRGLALEYAPRGAALRDFDGGHAQPRAGHLAALVLPDGGRVEYGYDARGNLVEARSDDGTARRYHYEDPLWPHHLTGLTERTGTRFARWAYDERGRAVLSEHADGVERVTLAYDAPIDRGEAVGATGTTTVTDSLGATSVYTWRRDPASGASLLLEASGAGCATCPPTAHRYAYGDDGRLASAARLDDDGAVLAERRYAWTPDGRLAAAHERGEDGLERMIERREYVDGIVAPALVARPSVNGAAERTVETTFAADGSPTSITERGYAPRVVAGPDGTSAVPTSFVPIERTVRLGYEDGLLATIDGPRDDVADVTRLERDASGRVVAIHPPASPAIRIVGRDALGRPDAFRLGSGSPWQVERDDRGEIVRVTHRGLSVRYTRDAEGRITSVVDTDGRMLYVEHDAAGRPQRMIDDLGRVTRWFVDSEGRAGGRTLYGVDGALVQSLERLYDARGRLIAATETRVDDDGASTSWRTELERDAAGRPVASSDPASGARRTLDVDPIARSVTSTDAFGAATRVELDALGHPFALTDARANRTEALRDDFGRVVRLDSPDTGVTVTEFDAAGNPVRRRDGSGAVTVYTWDAANRLVARRDADGLIEWTYGGAEEGGAHGRLVRVANTTTVERFDYDAEGQLVAHAREIDGHSFATRYAYDERGRLVDKHLPDGQTLRHHYHESGPDRGRLRAITRARWFGLASETLVGEIDADARDGAAGHVSLGGIAMRRRHAPSGELRSLEIGRTLSLAYRFDAAGRIVDIERDGRTSRYGYTAGRLTRALTANGAYTYRYDALGNRVERRVDDATGSRHERYRYAAPGDGNRLLSVRDEIAGTERGYDYTAGGAPSRVGELAYVYDASHRPVTVSRDGRVLARYAYNPFGERVRKTVYPEGDAPVVTYFLHDGTTLAAEADGAGRITAQYVYLDGYRAVAKLEGRTAYAIHGDHLGTPLLMTDADGDVVWRADHAPFGEARIAVETVRLDLRLPGQYADAETGTHYNYRRDYDPSTGRYATSDPIGLAGGTNTYAYALADPLGRIDPLGLDSLTLSGGLTLPEVPGDTTVPAKPSAGERIGEAARRFAYFPLWVGEQYAGYARGFFGAAGEVVVFAGDVLRYATDAGALGIGADLLFEDPPAWMPSYERFRRTNEAIVDLAEQVAADPSLLWQAITDPYVTAWAECRYGEAIGRGVFEAATVLLPAGLAARLSTLARASRVTLLADLSTVLRRAESMAPDEYALAVRELAEEARDAGHMDELIEAARQSDTLDELVRHGELTPVELAAVSRSLATPGSVGDANFAQPVIRSDETFSPDGLAVYSDLVGREIRTVDELAEAIRRGEVSPQDVPLDYVDLDGTRLILNTRTSTALQRAGVPRDEWYGVNRTGQTAFFDNKGSPVPYDQLARDQLRRNRRHAVPGQIGWPDLLEG